MENFSTLVVPSKPQNTAKVTSLLSNIVISREQVRPFPKAGPRKQSNCGSPKGKTRILTETTKKLELEHLQAERQLKRVSFHCVLDRYLH